MYKCIYVYMNICVYVYMYIWIYVYVYMCVYVYMYICIYVYIYMCIWTYVYIYMYICVYMYICIYVYMCIYIYVCGWGIRRYLELFAISEIRKPDGFSSRQLHRFDYHDRRWPALEFAAPSRWIGRRSQCGLHHYDSHQVWRRYGCYRD